MDPLQQKRIEEEELYRAEVRSRLEAEAKTQESRHASPKQVETHQPVESRAAPQKVAAVEERWWYQLFSIILGGFLWIIIRMVYVFLGYLVIGLIGRGLGFDLPLSPFQSTQVKTEPFIKPPLPDFSIPILIRPKN